MDEQNPAPEDSQPQQPHDPNAPAPLRRPAKRRKKRWWLRITLALIIVVVSLALLAPTILSMGWARSAVLSYVSDSFLNGRVEAGDWSIRWTEGIDIQDIKVYDDQHRPVASIKRLQAPVSLVKTIRSGGDEIELGNVVIDGLTADAKFEQGGQINLAKLLKPSNKPKSTEKSKLPKIHGTVTINNRQVTIASAGNDPTLYIVGGQIKANIVSLNDPINIDLRLPCRLGEAGTEGTLALAATAKVFDQDEFNIDKLEAKAKLDLMQLDISAANPFLKLFGAPVELGGSATGTLEIAASGLKMQSANGVLNITDQQLSGAALNGDKLVFKKLSIPIEVSRQVVDARTTQMKFKSDIDSSAGKISIAADASQEAIESAVQSLPAALAAALKGKPATQPVDLPAGTGYVSIGTEGLDVASLLNQLRNTVHLLPGMTLDKGTLALSTRIDLGGGFNVSVSLPDLAGTRDGAKVAMKPVKVAAKGSLIGGAQPNLRVDLAEVSAGDFLKATAGGQADKFAADCSFDAAILKAEAGQFVQVDEYILPVIDKLAGLDPKKQPAGRTAQLAGKGTIHLEAAGDVRSATSGSLKANATITGLVLGIKDQQPLLAQPSVAMTASALAKPGTEKDVTVIDGAITFTSGEAGAPTIDIDSSIAGATLRPAGSAWSINAPFEVKKLKLDVPKAQQQFAALLPMLEKLGLKLKDGTVDVQLAGTFKDNVITLTGKPTITATNFAADMTSKDGTISIARVDAVSVVAPGTIDLSGLKPKADIKGLEVKLGGKALAYVVTNPAGKVVQSISGQEIKLQVGGDVSHDGGSTRVDKLAIAVAGSAVEVKAPAATVDAPPVTVLSAGDLHVEAGGSANIAADGSIALTNPNAHISADRLTARYVDTYTKQVTEVLSNDSVKLDADGTLTSGPGGLVGNLSVLSLSTGSKLLGIAKEPGDLSFALKTVNGKSVATAAGKLTVTASDLKKLDAIASALGVKLFAQPQLLNSGSLVATVALGADQAKLAATIDGTLALDVADAAKKKPVAEEFALHAQAETPVDLSTITGKSISLKSKGEFLSVQVDDPIIRLSTPAGEKVSLYDMVQQATISAEVADVGKLQTLLALVSAPADGAPNAAGSSPRSIKRIELERAQKAALEGTQSQPLPPLELTGGTIKLQNVTLRRVGEKIEMQVPVQVAALGFTRGAASYQSKGVSSINLKATLDATAAPGQSFSLGQLTKLQVDQLTVKLDTGDIIELAAPMTVSNLGQAIESLLPSPAGEAASARPAFTAQANLHVAGQLEGLLRLVEALQARPRNSLEYAGGYDLTPTLSADQKSIKLNLNGQVTNFRSGGERGFGERLIAIALGGTYDIPADSILATAKVSMQQSQAIEIATEGDGISIKGLSKDREIHGKLTITRDWEKLWRIVHPLLMPADPNEKDSFADLKITGVGSNSFSIDGKLPADLPFDQAIKQLTASGAISFATFQWQGLELSQKQGDDLPFTLRDGWLRIGYLDAKQPIPPMALNGGQANIGGAAIDLNNPRPQLRLPRGLDLLKNVTLGPVLAKKLGGLAPLLVNAERANGVLSIRVVASENIPLDWFAASDKRDPEKQRQFDQDKGRLELAISLADLQAASPLTVAMDQLRLTRKPIFPASIQNGKVVIEHGRIQSNIALNMSNDPKTQMSFSGGMLLNGLQWDGMRMLLPKASLNPDVAKVVMTEGLQVPFEGPLSSTPDLGKALQKSLIPGSPEDLLKGLFNQPGKEPDKGNKPNKGKDPNDPLDIFNDLLNPDKNKDKDKK